jgi:hypothetical protein
MERSALLRRVKIALQAAFGKRLRGVLLYGSEVRGTAEHVLLTRDCPG